MIRISDAAAVVATALLLVLLRFAWYDHFAGVAWAHMAPRLAADIRADPEASLAGLANGVVLVCGLAWLTAKTGDRSPVGGLLSGLTAFVFFALTAILPAFIYADRLKGGRLPRQLIVDGGYALACLLLAGLAVGVLIPGGGGRARSTGRRPKLFAAER